MSEVLKKFNESGLEVKDFSAADVMMLAAAASTGHRGTIELAAQLVGAQPCPQCDYVNTNCRCKKENKVSVSQQKLMKFDPATGDMKPYPSHAAQYREYHGKLAWIFNPWSGDKRHPADIGTDPFGFGIHPDGDPVYSAGGSLSSIEARYRDLLNNLGQQGHDGALAEIRAMRTKLGLSDAQNNSNKAVSCLSPNDVGLGPIPPEYKRIDRDQG